MPFKHYSTLKPHHINATCADLEGNNGLGRYVFLCGSMERAQIIGERFNQMTVKTHPRGHHLYLGTIDSEAGVIDVASISTGMGAPSTEIIMHELCMLGARRFLRVGTSGTLQPHYIKVGSVVIASAAVRDEGATANYITRDFPALASLQMVNASLTAAKNLQLSEYTYTGIVHSKDTFFGRERGCSFLQESQDYMAYLKKAGVLVSEMECSMIFTLSSIVGYETSEHFTQPQNQILAGAVLAVVGNKETFGNLEEAQVAIERAIEIGFEAFRVLKKMEG